MFTKETWYNQKRLYHVFLFHTGMVYLGGVYEIKIEISDFVLYYYVCADFFIVTVYRSLFPCAVGNGNPQYGCYAGCKRSGF